MNDLFMRIEKGKQRSRMIRLIITTTGRFPESGTKFHLEFLSKGDRGHLIKKSSPTQHMQK